jgi:uncharacterized repeat protein (TIGR03847 family)
VSASFELSDVGRATVGTVGVPGQRTFYLQAREGDRLVSLKLEKQQVAALAQLLGELLSDLPAAGPLPTDLDLEEPVLAEWSVGAMQLAYDSAIDRIVLMAEEATAAGDEEEEEEDSGSGAIGRLAISRAQAAAIVGRAEELVTSGRPPCPLCGYPLDPSGHSCPRTNGHGPPKL